MSDLANRLRAIAYDADHDKALELDAEESEALRAAAAALDKAEAYGETMYKNWQLALNQRDYAEAKFAAPLAAFLEASR